jgi:hypothetical protein
VCESFPCWVKTKDNSEQFNGVLSGTVSHSGVYSVIMISFHKQTHIHTHSRRLNKTWPHIVRTKSKPFQVHTKSEKQCISQPEKVDGRNFVEWMREGGKESRSISDLLFLHSSYGFELYFSSLACFTFKRFYVIWRKGFPIRNLTENTD